MNKFIINILIKKIIIYIRSRSESDLKKRLMKMIKILEKEKEEMKLQKLKV